MKETEHQLQKAIIQYLEMKHFYVMRLNSGLIPAMYKGQKRMIALSKKGTPDLMAFKAVDYAISGIVVRKIHILFIEVKLPGKKATEAQIAMMETVEAYGAECFVIHSIEELQAVIQ